MPNGSSVCWRKAADGAAADDATAKVERLGAMGPTDDGDMNHNALAHEAMRRDGNHPAEGPNP
jgi:hypothetical protein